METQTLEQITEWAKVAGTIVCGAAVMTGALFGGLALGIRILEERHLGKLMRGDHLDYRAKIDGKDKRRHEKNER